jgi:hypothetical protein
VRAAWKKTISIYSEKYTPCANRQEYLNVRAAGMYVYHCPLEFMAYKYC